MVSNVPYKVPIYGLPLTRGAVVPVTFADRKCGIPGGRLCKLSGRIWRYNR